VFRRRKKQEGPGAWKEWQALPKAMPYVRGYGVLLTLSVILTVLVAIVALAQPWPLAIMLDSVLGTTKGPQPPPGFLQVIVGPDPGRYFLLVVVVIGGFLQVVLSHGLTVVHDYVNAKMEQNMVLDLRSDLFKHVQRLSLTFHDQRATGQLMAQINMQAASLGNVIMSFPPMAQSLLTLIGMLTIALFIDWQVTLVSLVAVPFLYWAIGLYGTRIVPRVRFVQGLEWKSLSIVYEAVAMLRVIVSFGRERYEHRRFREQGQTAVDERIKLTVRQTVFSLGIATATGAGTALVLGFGALHVIQGQITTGELIVLMTYIASVYEPLESISTTLGHLNQEFVYLNASMELLRQEPEVNEHPRAVDLGRATGAVTFDKVNFSYEGRKDTIRGVDFHVEPGQRVAIVGPTGAGKSTLVSLLVRFYDPETGSVKIDGTDITRVKLQSLRQQLALVLQDPLLFSGTIAENIRYGRLDATMDEIVDAAKAANAHDFVENLPQGYETEVGEGGAQLSGGERQRISVARAFVRNAPILILDEPTSSIDSKTESVILDALDQLMIGRTSVMIAHRLSTIRDADKILVLNGGELVEQGTHEELIAHGGLYRQLYDAQTTARKATVGAEDEALTAQVIESITMAASKRAAEATHHHEGDGTTPPPEIDEHPVTNGAGDEPSQPVAPPEPQAEPAETAAPNGHDAVPDEAQNGERDASRVENGKAELVSAAVKSGNGRHVQILGPREEIRCDFCQRTLLKGENAEPFLAPIGERQGSIGLAGDYADRFLNSYSQHEKHEHALVCELCWPAAEEKGWIMLATVGGRK
jgi:ABC-type multidrug transport system fused ATPase/permease subunit